MQKFCKGGEGGGGGGNLEYLKMMRAQLQAASGGVLEDNV